MTMANLPRSEYRLTAHARQQMARRGISEAEVNEVLQAPEQVEEVGEGRLVFQSRKLVGVRGTLSLLRVFVDVDRSPPEVVTAYRTSRVAKYWRDKP